MTRATTVIGIVGSPRRGGNTDVLVEEVLRGAQDAGAAASKVMLQDMNIGPCRGCDECAETRRCVQVDDMAALVEQMERSDVWVLGTPVYWWGPTAQFKAFLDRWYARGSAAFRGRRTILVIPLGDDDEGTARHTVGMLQDSLDYVEAELYATVIAAGVNRLGEVRGRPHLLASARLVGTNAITDR
jgi:multimeric flavodoxin WrbA